jgi:hypothetical protein
MQKQQALVNSKQKDFDVTKLYILTKPTKLSDLTLDDMYDPLESSHSNWKARARAFRERKDREFHHQF